VFIQLVLVLGVEKGDILAYQKTFQNSFQS